MERMKQLVKQLINTAAFDFSKVITGCESDELRNRERPGSDGKKSLST